MGIDENTNMSVVNYNQYLEENNKRDKNKTALEFEEMGGQFMKEIDKKKKRKKLHQNKLILYILKHHGEYYDEKELQSYSPEDIQEIYIETKKENRPTIINFLFFLFNIE